MDFRIGVVGAGATGTALARAVAGGGAGVLLHDADPDALERGMALLADADAGAVRAAPALDDLAGCAIVVEAILDDLDAKRWLFAALTLSAPEAVLVTTGAPGAVGAVAGGLPAPGAIVGLRLHQGAVEVLAGLETSPHALATAAALAATMGSVTVRGADGPGGVVERCGHPLAAEALRCVEDGLADPASVDRLCRAAGMAEGPFERQDRLGVGVALAATEALHRASYGEPRWRPSPVAARLVAAGHLGVATGRGWYAHPPGAAQLLPEPEPGNGTRHLVVVPGEGALAHDLRALADATGFRVEQEPGDDVPWLIVDADPDPGSEIPLQGAPQVLLCATSSLHQLDPAGGAVGFHALSPLEVGGVVELTRQTHTTALAAERAVWFFDTLGLRAVWVGDAPGLVLGRMVAQLANEAAFALAGGVTDDPGGLDDAVGTAFGLPRGPLTWADEIGLDHVLAILDGLREETGEERYRAAPLLRRLVAEGRTGMLAGEGFHAYEEPE